MRVFQMAVVAGALVASLAGAQEMAPRYPETLELVGLVEDAVALVESQGVEKACGQFREAGSRWFGDQAYVFVLSMEGQAICHPARPSLEGQYLNEMRDPKGKPILELMAREVAASDDGWVHYQWPRPGERVFRWKTTYLQKATAPDGTTVMVSSGRYQMKMEPFFVVEQVEDAIATIRERGEEQAFADLRDPSSGFIFYNAYVFVLDSEGILLVNNGFPENEDKNLIGMRDIDGRPFVQEMLQVPAGGSAWVHYKWPKPGDTRPSAKSSFVRRVDFDGRQLVVGSGVYFEQEPEVRDLGPKPDVD